MKSESLQVGTYRPSSLMGAYVPAPMTDMPVSKQRSYSTMRSSLPEELGLDDDLIKEGRGLVSRLETPASRVLGYSKAFHEEVKKINQTVDVKDLLSKDEGIFKRYMPGVMTKELRTEFDKLNLPFGIHQKPFNLDPKFIKRENPAKQYTFEKYMQTEMRAE